MTVFFEFAKKQTVGFGMKKIKLDFLGTAKYGISTIKKNKSTIIVDLKGIKCNVTRNAKHHSESGRVLFIHRNNVTLWCCSTQHNKNQSKKTVFFSRSRECVNAYKNLAKAVYK